MRFHTKLLILLLSISLLPMLLLRCNNQRAAQDMGREIAAHIRSQLINRSSLELKQQVSDHAFVMLRERQLLELALRTQATAMEQLIAGEAPHPPVGDHQSLDLESQSQRHCRLRGSGRCPPADVFYDRFAPLVPGEEDDPRRLQPLVPMFQDLAARYSDLLLWQYVFMPEGARGVFPATSLRTIADDSDLGAPHTGEDGGSRIDSSRQGMRGMGRWRNNRDHDASQGWQRWSDGRWMPGMRRTMSDMGMAPDWHRRALETNAPVWGRPHVDPLTRKSVIAVSMLVRDSEGAPVASTAIVVEVGALLRVDDHLDELSSDLETLVVLPQSPGDQASATPAAPASADEEQRLRVLARQTTIQEQADEQEQETAGHMQPMRAWRVTDEKEWLASSDEKALAAVLTDIQEGRSGVRELPYQGRDSLWAYGNIEPGGASLLLIAPKQDLVAEAEYTQNYVLQRFQRAIYISGLIMAGMLALVTVLALLLSKRFTRRIEELAHGFERVSSGDFSVRLQVHSRDEIGRLGQGFNTMVPALEERFHMRQALEVAHEIQRSLLPHTTPEIPGFQLAGGSVYSESTGGDYYDFIPQAGGSSDASIGLAVGDVTGHGLPAAMLMTTARAFLRQRASLPGGPGDVVADINRQLNSDVDQTGRFMTLFYAVLEPDTATLRWTRAGHDPALLYSPQDDSFSELAGEGLPLGAVADWQFEERNMQLRPGQLLCIATDGIWEAANPAGEMYGKQRLQNVLRANAQAAPDEVLQAVLDDLRRFCCPVRGQDAQPSGEPQKHTSGTFEDDVTLLLLKAL